MTSSRLCRNCSVFIVGSSTLNYSLVSHSQGQKKCYFSKEHEMINLFNYLHLYILGSLHVMQKGLFHAETSVSFLLLEYGIKYFKEIKNMYVAKLRKKYKRQPYLSALHISVTIKTWGIFILVCCMHDTIYNYELC